MNGAYTCGVRPSHPCIKSMTLARTLADGGTIAGCVCGIVYTGGGSDTLAIAGRTGGALMLTAICWQPETLMPGDTLTSDSASYVIRSVSQNAGGVLSLIVTEARPSDI